MLTRTKGASIRVESDCTPFVPTKGGVSQGCVVSPTLNKLYAGKITSVVKDFSGKNVGGGNKNTFIYADNTTVISDSEEPLHDLIGEIHADGKSSSIDLEINTKKTKILTGRGSLKIFDFVLLEKRSL